MLAAGEDELALVREQSCCRVVGVSHLVEIHRDRLLYARRLGPRRLQNHSLIQQPGLESEADDLAHVLLDLGVVLLPEGREARRGRSDQALQAGPGACPDVLMSAVAL